MPTTLRQTEPSDTSTLADIHPVQSSDVPYVWNEAGPLIEKATEGKFSKDDVLNLLSEKKAQLWVVVEDKKIIAALVTTLENTWVRVLWAGGESYDHWPHAIGVIEQWAKSKGFERSIVVGRPGWKKKLPDYRQTAIVLEKVL